MTNTLERHLVFSDLDGSLLDHHTYTFEPALPAVKALRSLGIPLILASSKTHAEIAVLREDLGSTDPFICENGAGIAIPTALATSQPAGTRREGDFWLYEPVQFRQHWLDLLEAMKHEFAGEFLSFHDAGVTGIMELTGLSPLAAKAANERRYSEPVAWLGSDENKYAFVARLREAGATVQQGGRFMSVSGAADKGQALAWLRAFYRELWQVDAIEDLAAGDSANDIAMLEAAGTALLVQSPVHEFPRLERTNAVIKSSATGPTGWGEGVIAWLRSLGLAT